MFLGNGYELTLSMEFGAVLRFASKRVVEEESHAKWERSSIGIWERNRVQPKSLV